MVFLVSGCHCGPWELLDTDMVLYQVHQRDDRWLLSAWLRNRYASTGKTYEAKERGGRELPTNLREPPVLDKIDAATLLLADRSAGFGSEVAFTVAEVAPLIWARPSPEVGSIIAHLQESGLAVRHDSVRTKGEPLRLSLTAKGWQRVDHLRPLGQRGRKAFVATAFTDVMAQVYDLGIRPALIAAGYEPYRVDRDHFSEKIDDRIMAELRRCALLVADFTAQRPNVYFETGFALGLGVPVVWTVNSADVNTLHFDVRQYPCLVWSDASDLCQQLEARIRALHPVKPDVR
jgi:hypothetical protein